MNIVKHVQIDENCSKVIKAEKSQPLKDIKINQTNLFEQNSFEPHEK